MLKNNTVRIILLSLTILCIGACKSKKPMVGEDLKPRAIKNVIKSHEKSFPGFESLSGKMKASYRDKNMSQTVNITYRIQKDEKIWMSAKAFGLITVAKIYITPKRVQFYEKINNEYFDGDFELISNLLGVDLNFNQLQNLLLAQSLIQLNNRQSSANFEENQYAFKHSTKMGINVNMDVDAQHFRLKKQEIIYPELNQFLTITYPSFQTNKQSFYPKKINILAKNKEEEVNLSLEFKSLNVGEELSFPFDIPSNYKEIKL